MNKTTLKNKKFVALLAVMLMLVCVLAGCKQEPKQETQPAETTAAAEAINETTMETMPTETEVIETFPEVEAPEAGSITYAEYLELTAEEQQAYYENFESADAFFAWLNPAKEEYAESLLTKPADGNGEAEGPISVGEESVEEWE